MNTLGPAKYVRYKQNVVIAGVIYVVIMDLVLKKLEKMLVLTGHLLKSSSLAVVINNLSFLLGGITQQRK
jgi:hypothetical protein